MSTWRRVLTVIEPHPGEHFKDKAIAVGLAFLLWLAINAEEAVPQIFQAVPVNITPPPQALAIAQEWPDTLEIRVRGSARDLGNLRPGRLSPQIDLTNATRGENVFTITAADIVVPRGVEVVRIIPDRITIVLDDRKEKLVEVSAVAMGEPASGYEVVGRSTSPDQAWLSGPQSLLDDIDQIITNTIDVGGRRETFTQTVTLLRPSPLIELSRETTAELTVEIVERAATAQFDTVGVEVINTSFRVDVNPTELSVVLSGPPSLLAQLSNETITLVIDATDLQPRDEDYRIEPQIRFDDPEAFASIEVLALTPQRAIDVHVYPSSRSGPRLQDADGLPADSQQRR